MSRELILARATARLSGACSILSAPPMGFIKADPVMDAIEYRSAVYLRATSNLLHFSRARTTNHEMSKSRWRQRQLIVFGNCARRRLLSSREEDEGAMLWFIVWLQVRLITGVLEHGNSLFPRAVLMSAFLEQHSLGS